MSVCFRATDTYGTQFHVLDFFSLSAPTLFVRMILFHDQTDETRHFHTGRVAHFLFAVAGWSPAGAAAGRVR